MEGLVIVLVIGVAICDVRSNESTGDMLVQKLEELRIQLKLSDWLIYNEKISAKISISKKSPTSNCDCVGPECTCCSTMPGGKKNVDGCFNAKLVPETGMLHFIWHGNGKTMFDQQTDPSSGSEEPVCQPVPGTDGSTQCCVTMDNTMHEDSSMTCCPHMEMKMWEDTGAMADIECLHYKDGKMSVGDRNDPSKPGMFKLKYKEPMKKAVRHVMDIMN